ncbi:MAG: EamA family transporter [bacterium]|nr:EamA family transporter [bacterium]
MVPQSVFIFAWIASIMFGLEAISGKLTSRHAIKNPWLLNFFWLLFILVLTVPVALWGGARLPTHWTNIIFASFFYALGSALYVLALYKVDVSVIAPLYSFRTVVAVILGTIILGEILTTKQYLLIAIIVIFGIFTSIDERFHVKSFFNRGIVIVLCATVTSAIMAVFIKMAVVDTNFWDTTLWMALLGQIWLLPTILLFKKDLLTATKKQYLIVLAVAAVGVIGTLASNKAYSINVGIASAIIALPISMIIAFLFSSFAPTLLEKHPLKIYAIRFVSAAIMIVAALNL